MSWFLILLAVVSALLIWRDLKLGRVYETPGQHGQFDYDAPEHFDEKEKSPIYYWAVILIAVVCCLITFVFGILLLFIPEERQETGNKLIYIPLVAMLVLMFYIMNGLSGRVSSWIKNYGSIDKKW